MRGSRILWWLSNVARKSKCAHGETPVLEWIVGRCHGTAQGGATPLGVIPAFEHLNWRGLEKFTREQYEEITRVNGGAWKEEVASHDELLGKLGAQLPRELGERRSLLHQKLAA